MAITARARGAGEREGARDQGNRGVSWGRGARGVHDGRGAQGFSLLEVVLAIAILTAVTLATTLLIVPIARQSRINRETEIAAAAAQRVIEKFQSTPFHQIVTTYPQGTTLAVPELSSGSIAVSYTDPDADPLLIHVDLSWESEELGSMLVNFHTVRTE